MTPCEQLLQLIALSFQGGTLRKLIFSKPKDSAPQKVVARLSKKQGGVVLACEETHPLGKVKHLTYPQERLADIGSYFSHFDQINLMTGAGDTEFRRSKNGKETLIGGAALLSKFSQSDRSSFACYITDLDRKKAYALDGSEPFLRHLGISDATGRVHDKMQAKYRQINRFIEHLEEIYPHLPEEGLVRVYDLCCGKSYLSFAVYHYLTHVKGRSVDMFCMDLKEDVIRYCEDVSHAVDFHGMRFQVGDIRLTPKNVTPDLVVSLHACDIATDIVLDTAITLGAKVILSTPCCHRYLNDRLTMDTLPFVTKHPYLKTKLCEVLTEAIRLARLEANGYTVTALEMTDPSDTPKNTLLRAIRQNGFRADASSAKEKQAAYQALLESLMGEAAKDYLKEIKL